MIVHSPSSPSDTQQWIAKVASVVVAPCAATQIGGLGNGKLRSWDQPAFDEIVDLNTKVGDAVDAINTERIAISRFSFAQSSRFYCRL